MNLVIWIESDNSHIDTGLAATPVENPLSDRDEVLLPFSSRENALDCLRMIVRRIERGDSE